MPIVKKGCVREKVEDGFVYRAGGPAAADLDLARFCRPAMRQDRGETETQASGPKAGGSKKSGRQKAIRRILPRATNSRARRDVCWADRRFFLHTILVLQRL